MTVNNNMWGNQTLTIHKDNSPSTNMKAIQDVIAYVEWESVRQVMQYLDWKWANLGEHRIPTIQELEECACDLAEKAIIYSLENEKSTFTGIGGIVARTDWFEDGSIGLTVAFELSSWNNYL